MAEFDTARERLLSNSVASNSAQVNVGGLKRFIDTARKADDSLMDHRAYKVKLADDAAAEARTTMTSARFTLAVHGHRNVGDRHGACTSSAGCC
ncbi:protein of unknown function [Burkholderia multivorans]